MAYEIPTSFPPAEATDATAVPVVPSQPALAQPPEAAIPGPATANEGSHPLAVSPAEGLFSIPQEGMVAALQKLLRLKYGAVIMYMNYGDRLRAHFRDSLYDHFQEHMREEITFCYDLAMKITALAGEPAPKVGTVPDVTGLHQIFMNIIVSEQEQIQVARDILAKVGDHVGLKVLVENMVLADQRHCDDARRMLLCEQE
jgi:bacterioferritin (cytochrome b1)